MNIDSRFNKEEQDRSGRVYLARIKPHVLFWLRFLREYMEKCWWYRCGLKCTRCGIHLCTCPVQLISCGELWPCSKPCIWQQPKWSSVWPWVVVVLGRSLKSLKSSKSKGMTQQSQAKWEHKSPQKLPRETVRINDAVILQDTKPIYKTWLCFSTLTTFSTRKGYLERNPVCNIIRKNKILTNLTKKGEKNVHSGRHPSWPNKLKATQVSKKTPCFHGLGDFVLLSCRYYPKPSTDSLLSISKPQG